MILSVENLSFSYNCWNVLHDVTFTASSGNLICMLGKNGSGKSTLFRCVLGILKYTQGHILVDGQDIRTRSARELAQIIAYIPQNTNDTFAYTVLDMVLMGTTSQLGNFSCPSNKQRTQAMEAIEAVGISSLTNRNIRHLSGGERQLVLIARALAQQTGILIMDEPCSSLDYGNQIRVMEQIKKLSVEKYLVILSTHNPEHAFLFADKVIVLLDGTVKHFGPPVQILDESLLERLYGIPVSLFKPFGDGKTLCCPRIS